MGWLLAWVTHQLAVSRERLTIVPAQGSGVRSWFARLHWVLVASVATTQLVGFSAGMARLGQSADHEPDPSTLTPLRRLAKPSARATAARPTTHTGVATAMGAAPATRCGGIRLGEVLVNAAGEPVFATLSDRGQAYAFPRRIGDHLAGAWEVSRLSVIEGSPGSRTKAAHPVQARVELKAGDESCTLATQRIRKTSYSAAL